MSALLVPIARPTRQTALGEPVVRRVLRPTHQLTSEGPDSAVVATFVGRFPRPTHVWPPLWAYQLRTARLASATTAERSSGDSMDALGRRRAQQPRILTVEGSDRARADASVRRSARWART
jgi:hypothetical protein